MEVPLGRLFRLPLIAGAVAIGAAILSLRLWRGVV